MPDAPLPPPSVLELPAGKGPDAPADFIVRFAIWLRRSIQRFADMVVPAEVAMFERVTGIAQTQTLHAVARFGVVDALGDERLTAGELAERTGTNADALHRTLRGLAMLGVFTLHSDGRVENNRLSRALRSGLPTRGREWAIYFGSGSNARAWGDYAETVRTGESAFDRVHGMNVWDWFDAHPDERENFAHCMMGLTLQDAPFIARLYPFEEIKHLCDVGGGRGTLLSELLLRYPHLNATLCDAPGVIESARTLLGHRRVDSRVTLSPGNFFEAVPRGADAYLMKNILHDWDDATSITLLRNCREAMDLSARMLLVEALVETNDPSGIGPFVDLQMMVACSGGRERSIDDFKRLLAESGFRFNRVFPGVTTAVIEGIAI